MDKVFPTWHQARRKAQSFSSFASLPRGSISLNIYEREILGSRMVRSGSVSSVGYSSGTASKAKRLAATRHGDFGRAQVDDQDFKRARRMVDKELADRINRSATLGSIVDMYGQHLIHFCALTDRPLSVAAICNSPYSHAELNAKDRRDRTPLHLAVAGEQEAMVRILLDLGALVDVYDYAKMTPLHLAASLGNVNILTALLDKFGDPDIPGDGGYTAIHFAAAADKPDCIKILIERRANLAIRNSNGSFAVHTAAKCGSAKALEALIVGAIQSGQAQRQVLTLKDREGQLPIHNAVNNGGAEAVIVCLQHGSSLLTKKDNGLTPVHYAATQGNLSLLKTMYDFNPGMFREALLLRDITCRTPLHWAAIFNHDSVVKYLINMSDVNTFDENSHTPLLSAANNGCWLTLMVLLQHKATNTEVMDTNQRNALHLAVMQGMSLEKSLSTWQAVRNIVVRCNDADVTGSTPLHYAAWNGDVSDVKSLLELGANTNVKNKHRQNPFHIACKNGCYDVCLLLLNEANGSRLKNEQDESGQSPLHMAASRGFVNVVNVLLQRGAVISKDKFVNTPLHLAAAGGHIPCVHALLSVHLDLLDMENLDGNTPLHLAAVNGHPTAVNLLLSAGAEIIYNSAGKCFFDDCLTMSYREVIEVLINHERWDEILSVFSQIHGQLFLGLVHYLPICCVMVLDRCVEKTADKNSKDYTETYNFRYLQLGDQYASFAKAYKFKCSPLLPIEMMLQHERDDCLRHSLVTIYLKHKWKSYGRLVSFLDICIYCLYMGSLTFFVVTHRPLNHYHEFTSVQRHEPAYVSRRDPLTGQEVFVQAKNYVANYTEAASFNYGDEWFPPEARNFKQPVIFNLALLIICIYSLCHIVKEIVQLFTSGRQYFREANIFLDVATYTTALYFAFPFLLGYSTHTQWEAAAIAIFLAWFNFLVLCQRFDVVGLYIVMYLEIMKTLIQILFIFFVLMVAFGLVFYILQSEEDEGTHENPIISTYRSLILVFELDYVLTIMRPYKDSLNHTLHFTFFSFIFLAIFLLCMPLLLVNLMIGLAVGDIQSVLRSAHQQKLATQVAFHSKIEQRISFLSRMTPETLTLRPNDHEASFRGWYHKFFLVTSNKKKREDKFDVYRHRERNAPAMLALNEVRRDLGQMKQQLTTIMRVLKINAEDTIMIPSSADEKVVFARRRLSDDRISFSRNFSATVISPGVFK